MRIINGRKCHRVRRLLPPCRKALSEETVSVAWDFLSLQMNRAVSSGISKSSRKTQGLAKVRLRR